MRNLVSITFPDWWYIQHWIPEENPYSSPFTWQYMLKQAFSWLSCASTRPATTCSQYAKGRKDLHDNIRWNRPSLGSHVPRQGLLQPVASMLKVAKTWSMEALHLIRRIGFTSSRREVTLSTNYPIVQEAIDNFSPSYLIIQPGSVAFYVWYSTIPHFPTSSYICKID